MDQTTIKDAQEELEKDIVPPVTEDKTDPDPVEDDFEPVAAAAGDESDQDNAEAEDYVDPRVAIGRKNRENRMSEMDDDFEHGSDPKLHGGKWSEDGAAEEGAEDSDQADEGSDAAETFDIVVDGEKQTLTRDQMIERVQKSEAVDKRLDAARALTQDLAALRNNALENQQSESEQADQPEEASDEENQLDDDDLLELVEVFQTGDAAEAAKALTDFVARTQKPNQSPEDMERQFETWHSERVLKEKQQEQVEAWGQRNPDIAGDDELARMVVERSKGKVFQELVGIRFDANELNEFQQKHGFEGLNALHRQYRQDPRFQQALSQPDDILDKAAGELRAKFKMPDPNAQTEQNERTNRTERKKALSRQPRSAAVKAAPGTQQARQRTKPSDIVKKMRASRGQPVA